MAYQYFLLLSASVIGVSGLVFYGYNKIFGERKYKVLKDYKYKDLRIQLIKNPQNNVCGICYNILEENEEIGRFPKCDHHFCQKCVHKQIDDSQSNLNLRKHPCSMCMNV